MWQSERGDTFYAEAFVRSSLLEVGLRVLTTFKGGWSGRRDRVNSEDHVDWFEDHVIVERETHFDPLVGLHV